MSEDAPTIAAGRAESNPAPAAAIAPVHRHRVLITVLFVLATIVGIAAVQAVWVNRQVLDTNNWVSTSSRLLQNKEIQTAVAAYSVNQLFSSGVPQSEIKSVLPTVLRPLSGPISSGLEQLAGRIAPKLLATSQVQTAWREANRAAHSTFLRIVNGGGSLVSTKQGVVTLNLRAIVAQLGAALGVQSQVAAATAALGANAGKVRTGAAALGVQLPPSDGQLVIMRSNQLATVQDIAADVKGLALVLPIITFVLFALAVWLSKRRRREALRRVGWCFVAIGIFELLARRITGNEVVDSLVRNQANRAAAHQAWAIGTTLLYDIAVALIVYGLVFVAAAWLAGHTRPARALRHALAPTLRERPVATYAAAYLALLLVILWGPTPASRQLPYIIVFILLIALGVNALRRQTAREFPQAQPGDTSRAAHTWYSERRRPGDSAESGGASSGRLAELERLSSLHDHGSLTDAEFAAEKASLMNGS